jgi:hypothetical protein
MQQRAICVRIARVERNIEVLHHRLHEFTPSQTADALYARTRLCVLKRSLKVLRTERDRMGKNEAREERPQPKRRLNAGHRHQQDAAAAR